MHAQDVHVLPVAVDADSAIVDQAARGLALDIQAHGLGGINGDFTAGHLQLIRAELAFRINHTAIHRED